jgi:hypothetical protein
MEAKTLLHFSLAAGLAAAAAADTLAQWTFNNKGPAGGANEERLPIALGASGVAYGLRVSQLFVNASHDFAGFNNVPNTVNDGFGFGNNGTPAEACLFIHRAAYFNDSETPDPRPDGRVTTWGNPANAFAVDTTVANSPLSFTVTANAISTVTVESLTIDGTGSGAAFLAHFQEANGAPGASPAASTTSMTMLLESPVEIAPGSSKTFTINLNSGALNSGHVFNTVRINGSVAIDTAVPAIAQWTFNDTGSGATEERLPAALGASGVAAGLTVTPLAVNPSHDFAGFNNVPDTANDGFGFGGNLGEPVMFIHRANYFNTSTTPDPRPEGRVTTWGNPTNTAGVDTTAANAPLSFAVTTDAVTTATLRSLTVVRNESAATLLYFQEAGAAAGAPPPAGELVQHVALQAPVVLGPGSSKVFTLNLNSGNLNSGHIINSIALNGSVSGGSGGGYASWAALHAGGGAPEGDFDRDGTDNGIEYFMGETGGGFTARPAPVGRTIAWPRDPAASVASFKVQTSETLEAGSWTDVAPSDPNLDLSDPNEVRYTLPEGAERSFVRLMVTP